MCGNCKEECCKSGCTISIIAKILVIIGGVNWGLVGIGMLFGGANWNVINLIFGSMPVVEAIIYILVGISAIAMIFGCKCGKCKNVCCSIEEKKEEVEMQ
ncbi:MAG: DUF378 domain-containing protein [Candidatus Woesebacteria bacterium]|nr:DUF378 domain-containing protein [Candidatus Woesebacteria bacterium]